MSKRGLYRPAKTEDESTMDKRKPLAQGRLVTQPVGGPRRCNVPRTTLHEDKKTSASRHMTEVQARVKAASFSRQLGKDEAPRRAHPLVTTAQSPKRTERTSTLDLSDSDTELNKDVFDSSILMIDASRQTRDANTSEVDIEIGHTRSPAKVVCHTPSAVQSRLRNSGDIAEARKVNVDYVPSVSISCPEVPGEISRFKSPIVIRENTIAGTPIDRHSMEKPVISKKLFECSLDDVQQNYVAQRTTPPRDLLTANVSDIVSDTSSVDSSLDVLVDSKATATRKHVSMSIADEQKKRKGATFSTSRYLHTSTTAVKSKSKGPLKATDRGIMGAKGKANESRSKSSLVEGRPKSNTSRYRAPAPDSFTSALLKPKASGDVKDSRTTPQKGAKRAVMAKTSGKKAYKTSTPTAMDNSQSLTGAKSRPKPRPKPQCNMTPDQNQDSHSYSSSMVSNNSQAVRAPGEVTQLDLDLNYARYLQYVYLESRARNGFRKQETNVMADLYAAADLIDQKQKEKDELDQQLARLRHANAVDNVLDIQEIGLESVVGGLDQIAEQCHTLSKAIDTTRHQIPTKGVHIPNNEDQYIDELHAALNESERLLGELSVMTREKQTNVTEFSNVLNTLNRTAREEVSELSECQESLAAATTLTVQECSLLVQDIQLAN